MADKPFWHESPDDELPGDDDGTTPQADSPDRKWSGDAIDPDTGEWRPKHLVEEYEIGGHKFGWMEGPIAEAQIHDADGNHLESVMVPFDPAEGEPDDAMLEDAQRWYQGLEYMRSIVKQDAIDEVTANLFKYKADGDSSSSELMISEIADAVVDTVKITVTIPDDDPTPPEQIEALQAEVDRLFAERVPGIVEAIAEVVNPNTGLTFWQDMARDVIAHALMYARDAATEEYGGPEAVKALDDDAAAAWGARVDDLYATGPFLSGAYIQGYRTWHPVLSNRTWMALDGASKQPADDPKSMFGRILKLARKNLGLPVDDDGSTLASIEPDATPAPVKQVRQIELPIRMAPMFLGGIGHVPTVHAWIHLVEKLWQPWDVPPDTWPEQLIPIDKGTGYIRFTFQENPNGATATQKAAAVELAQGLSATVPMVVHVLGLMYTPNRNHRGRMVATTAEIARAVYQVKPEKRHLEAVNDAMYTLGQLIIQGMKYHRKNTPNSKKREERIFPARHVLTWDKLHQNGRNVTYEIQLGESILAPLEDFARQVAGVPEGALALDARQPAIAQFANAIIMRCNLTWQTKAWREKGLTHREILEYAGYRPDTIDARRRPKIRASVSGILKQSALWDHRYAPGTDTGIDRMSWGQWLDGPRVLLTVHKHALPDHADADTTGPDTESPPQMHPSWG